MKGLRSSAQSKFDLRYHFVFVPRYRKRVLTGEVGKRIEGMIRFAAQIHEWEIYELAVNIDHVHLYMGAQPKFAPAEIMRIVKGGTSNKIRELFPELDEIDWGATFWADGYLVKTVGFVTDKVISEYVAKQR
ncbi:IS200/IS605 family transposase [Patescibacteria group bacterium]|nr:IS200/IS605 family transposase [Patescibacteria group bacterium]MCL5091941.1 IS200/IS605 family transposase [Patescibacteria group bacterium]